MADTAVHRPLNFTRTPEYTSQLHQEMYQLQQSGSFTDFYLNVDGQSIPCHRLVLASASPFFGAMFRSDMEECQKNETCLENVDFATANIILEYMYTGNIQCEYMNARNVMKAADFLQMPLAKEACEKYLAEELNVNNCLGLCKTGMMFRLDNLVVAAKSMMHESFNHVVESDEFKELTVLELIDYITEETNRIRNQDSLVHACIQWILFNKSERQSYIVDILKHINIEKCSYEFLNIMRGKYNDLVNNEFEQFIGGNILRRNMQQDSEEDNKYIILIGDNEKNDYPRPHLGDIEGDSWKPLSQAPPSVSMTWYSVCKANDGLIVTGGREAKKQCHMFTPKYNAWIRLCNMELGCGYHASESVGNFVYVMGGINEDHELIVEVRVLNLDDNDWTLVSPMLHTPGVLPITIQHEMSIYVILNTCSGNTDIQKKHGIDMQVYNTVKDNWKSGGVTGHH